MKNRSSVLRLLAVATAFIGLLTSQVSAQASNQPIPGIDVVVQKKPSGSAIRAITDKEGGFVFAGLKAGDYTIEVVVPPKLTEQYPGWYGGVDLGYRVNITLGKGPSKPINFSVRKDGQSLTGTVTAPAAASPKTQKR